MKATVANFNSRLKPKKGMVLEVHPFSVFVISFFVFDQAVKIGGSPLTVAFI